MFGRISVVIGSLWLVSQLIPTQTAQPAEFCSWGDAVEAGNLDAQVSEASGLAVSARYPNRLYHINDSGDRGRFLVTDSKGTNAQSVSIEGFTPSDVEDLAIGSCLSGEGDCLYLADIGDNARRRQELTVVVVKELAAFPASVPILERLRLKYPDGPHDAEALAVHPDGTLFILTKVYPDGSAVAQPAGPIQLFKLSKDRHKEAVRETVALELAATLDLAKLMQGSPSAARIPTGMDIVRDGKRALVIAYADAFEIALDLTKAIPPPESWREGKEYQRIKLVNLQQQEAIAYTPDGKSFLYSTEQGFGRSSMPARLMRVSCRP